MKKNVLSLILAAALVCALLPTAALAAASTATVTQVVPYKYNKVYDFSEGLAVVRNDNGWGVINTTGKEVIPCGGLNCDYVGDGFHDGCLSVGNVYDNYGEGFRVEWSFVDVTGRTIIPSATKRTYSQGWGIDEDQTWIRFHEGLARVWIDGKCGFFDTTGKEIVPCKYDEASHAGFSEGLAAVELNGEWGFVDKTGKEVVPPKYDSASDFSEGLAAVKLGDKYGYVDKTGKEVIPCQYGSAKDFENGRAVVTASTGQIANGHTVYAEGVIDKSGNVVVPFGEYQPSANSDKEEYHDGLKAAMKDGKWGFVDRAGNQIIPAKYDKTTYYNGFGDVSYTPSFSNGLAAVYLSGKGYGYIDLHGNEVMPFQYGSARQLSEGMLAVGVDGKWGFVRIEGLPTTLGAPIVEPEEPEEPTTPDTSKDFEINRDGRLSRYKGPGGNVVIPSNVTSIGSFAFEKYANPINVTIPDSVTSIGHSAFYQCPGLTSVTIPDSVTKIDQLTFHGCTNLASVTIPKSVTVIGYQAFFECTSLKSVVIPGSVTTLEANAFRGCTSLADVTIGKGVTTIGQAAFSGCTSLTNVIIPDSVTTLGLYAFKDCTNLTSIAIPSSITTIDYAAFRGSTNLTDVYYGGSEAQWKAITIESGNDPLLAATIHYNSAMPAQPVQPVPTAYASTQTVSLDGKPVTFYAYALKEGNGMTNYIKLRDVANLLNGSAARFQVGWDGSISITTKTAYTPNGTENVQNFTGNQTYAVSTSPVTVDGKAANLEAITLTDAKGGGYTYFKLRDLGKALNFNVGWTAERGIFVETDKPYNAND